MTTSFIEQYKTLPYIAHCYTNAWQYGANNASAFKKMLGPLADPHPVISMSINGGHKPVTIQMPIQDSAANAPSQGDIITLTQQDGDGSVIFAGIIRDLPDEYDTRISHQIILDPLSQEMGLTPFFTNYSAGTDPAQMFRDAINTTKHLTATTSTAPNLGLLRQYNFLVTGTVNRVAEEVIKMAGNANVFTFIDEVGQGWMGTASSTSNLYTVRRGMEWTARKYTAPIDKLYNWFVCVGGRPAGAQYSIAVVYDNGTLTPCTEATIPAPSSARTSQYGVRARMPHYHFPKLLDQTTLNNIAQTLGQTHNRVQVKIDMTLTNYPVRINLATTGAAALRYFDPDEVDFRETGATSGSYSPTYLITDLSIDGPVQKVTLTDLIPATRFQNVEAQKILEDMANASSYGVAVTDVGVITPGMVVGATGGGGNVPTTPSFYP